MKISPKLIIDAALMGNSHDAARWLEDDIEKREAKTRYIHALCHEVGIQPHDIAADGDSFMDNDGPDEPGNVPDRLWILIRATPAQRAMAYLKVVA